MRIPPCTTATTHLYLILKLLPSKHEFFYYVLLLLLLKYGVTEILPTSKVPVPGRKPIWFVGMLCTMRKEVSCGMSIHPLKFGCQSRQN